MRASLYFRRGSAIVSRRVNSTSGKHPLTRRAVASHGPPPPPTLPPPPPPPPTRPPPLPRPASSPSSSKRRSGFEEYWQPDAVKEGLKSGQLVKGRLHVPSFHTDRAFVIVEPEDMGAGADGRSIWIPVTGFIGRNRALHGDEVAALPLWEPWRPGAATSSQAKPTPVTPPLQAVAPVLEVDPEEQQRAQFRDAVLAYLRENGEGALPLSLLGQDENLQSLRRGLGSSLSTALRRHVDSVELVQEGSPPEPVVRLLQVSDTDGQHDATHAGTLAELAPPMPPLPPPPPPSSEASGEGQRSTSLDSARCRIVAVLDARTAAAEIVGVIRPPSRSSGSQAPECSVSAECGDEGAESLELGQLKVQPRDRRLPAFWVMEEKVESKPNIELEDDSGGDTEQSTGRKKRAALRKEAQSTAHAARAESVGVDGLLRTLEASWRQVKDTKSSGTGLLCVMQMVDWPCESLSPRARIIEVLGPQGSANAEADALLAFYGLEWRPFANDIEKSLKDEFPDGDSVVQKELAGGRADLRHLRCVTIDPPHARDLDDAVSIVPGSIEGSFCIGVHVADVTHFVAPATAVDLEARRRATTVYLVGKVYPMLPRWLSEKLCSLLPDGDRLAFSVFFTIDSDGQLVESVEPIIQRTVIRTCARLDYTEVDWALSTEGGSSQQISADVLEDLRRLHRLTAARRELRIRDGAVVLKRSSLAFNLDADGRVDGLTEEDPSSASHHLIEELMVLANHVVALRLVEAAEEGPGTSPQVGDGRSSETHAGEDVLPQPLLRRHPDTEPKVRQRLLEILPDHVREKVPQEPGLSNLLAWCEERLPPPTYQAVCADVMTAFKEAEYIVADSASATDSDSSRCDAQEESEPPASVAHWALSLPAYMHFTSPIRRYADVLVHRRLAHIISRENAVRPASQGVSHSPGAKDLARQRAEEHANFLESLKEAVKRCNVKKRDAQDAQLDSVQLALAEHVRRSGGVDVENAVITRILLPAPGAKEESEAEQSSFHSRLRARNYKEALEFYVPIAQCTRSVSLDVLNLELVSSDTPAAGTNHRGSASDVQSATSVRVRVRDSAHEVQLTALKPVAVRLVSGQDAESAAGGHWTIRFPWAISSSSSKTALGAAATLEAVTDRSDDGTGARPRPLPPAAPRIELPTARPPPPPRM